MRRLALLSAFLALPALGQGYTGAGFSGTTTNIVGTTSVCSVGARGTANGVCLISGGVEGEGSTANTFQATLAFGDSTADATASLIGTSAGALLTVGDGVLATPSIRGQDADTGLFFAAGEVHIGANGTDGLKITSNSAVFPTNSVVTGIGTLQVFGQALTTATMTQENAAQVRTVTSSYTWTNAMVVALGAGLTGDITVATLPAKTQLLDAQIVVTGAAAGPATVTASLGDAIGGTPFINLVVASDIKAAANTVYGDAVAERGTSIDSEFWYLPSYTATTLVTLHLISTVANLNTVTGSTGRVILTTRVLP